ncbi:MAG TPA: alpha-glucosidase [Chitinophagaceae bacterium]|nr:alpha-glucosidase [Chitinophagaceae bacterium]
MRKNLLWSCMIVAALQWCGCQNTPTTKATTITNKDSNWWKSAVIYQLYPRSFKDSDGDGIGDLKGILSELDYLQSLGIDAIWLNPIYSSPNDDNGYDVSDYRAIMKDFGTMEDFDALLAAMHQRGLKLIMDIVVNHSSDEHDWFRQSRSSRNNPYRNYYHWWPAEKGKPPYRYSLFDINHDAWKYDSLTNAYYLHYFGVKQPDLNWENPKLRQEIYDMMEFWAQKGVDGFRLDAFQFAAKDTSWPHLPQGYEQQFAKHVAMKPAIHNYLREMNEQVLSKYGVMSVAEGAGNSFEDAHQLVDAARKELNMAYAFEAVDLAKSSGYNLLQFKRVFSTWDSAFAKEGWLSIFLANHDNARMVTRFASDAPEHNPYAATMLHTFLLSMRGTPYCYYGDELGMTNPGFNSITDYRDKPALNDYQYQLKQGKKAATILTEMRFSCRDNGRTPMQWNTSANAGFTTGTPWIAVNKNYTTLNVAAQQKDSTSCLTYFKKMVALRKREPALVHGSYTLVDANNQQVYAYTRSWKDKKVLVLLNFSGKQATVQTGYQLSTATPLLYNYATPPSATLRPYEAVVYALQTP